MAMYVRHNTNESTEFMTNTQLGLDGAPVPIPAQTGGKTTSTMTEQQGIAFDDSSDFVHGFDGGVFGTS